MGAMPHYAYLLRCADGTFYAGYAVNLDDRLRAHNSLKSGAKYTRSRRPVELAYFEKFRSKSKAMRREAEFKKLRRPEKAALAAGTGK